MGAPAKDMSGETWGKLFVLERASYEGKPKWKCLCECGKTSVVFASNLRAGNTVSCGCHRVSLNKYRGLRHGASGTKLFWTWWGMNKRCHDPGSSHYKNYGGRGITVCKSWRESFENFYRDMGDKPSPELSVDRIDNNKGYSKKNCRWATAKEQAQNRRTTKGKSK